MIGRSARIGALSLSLATPLAAAAPPITAYGQLPTVETLRISPDGANIAMVVGGEEQREIQIRKLPGMAPLTAAPVGKPKVRNLFWASSGHLVAMTSTTASVPGLLGPAREWYQLVAYDLGRNKWRPLLGKTEEAMNVVAGLAKVVPGTATLMVEGVTFPGQQGVSTLFKIDLERNRETVVEVGTPYTSDWLLNDEGRAIARADYDSADREWRLFLRPGNSWTRAYQEAAPIDTPFLDMFDGGSNEIILDSHKSGEWHSYRVSLADGKWSEPVPEFDVDGFLTDPLTGRLIGTVDWTLDNKVSRFRDPADQQLWQKLVRAFKGEVVSFVSWSADHQRIIVKVEGPANGSAHFLVDRVASSATWLANSYKGIEPEHWQPVRTLHYAAADGHDIPAYLTLPQGRPAKGLPLVVLVHGGPQGRDYPGFDWWAQGLASRGYAVLQPQFRGSEGFGEAHIVAGHGEFGRKMQSDVSDGVRHLAKEGVIDPARTCVVGASYGGYAALAGVTLEQGIYRCAAGVAGVYDLKQMLSDAGDGGRSSAVRYWRRFLGVAKNSDPLLESLSPARQAAKAGATPILLVHGKDDTVVPYGQTTTMAKALTAAGHPPQVVTLPGEDHWLSRGPTRQQMLNAVVTFLEAHNPPTAVTTAAAP